MDDANRQTTGDTTTVTGAQDVDVGVNMDGGGATALNSAPHLPAAHAVDTTVIAVGVSAPQQTPNPDDAVGAALIQALRERRLLTLALADQVGEDRWRTPRLPHDHSLHDLLAALLAWDEWAAAIFEVSLLRALPPKLIAPTQAAEARHDFEARAFARYAPLARAELLTSLQASGERAISGAIGRGATGWHARPISGLALTALRRAPDTQADATQVSSAASALQRPGAADSADAADADDADDNAGSTGGAGSGANEAAQNTPIAPTVGDILRWLIAREERRDAAISVGLGVHADIEQLRARFTLERGAQR